MSASYARELLEAAIWRERGGDSKRGAADVDRILAAADAYADAEVSRVISDPALLAKRQRLLAATAERTGRPS